MKNFALENYDTLALSLIDSTFINGGEGPGLVAGGAGANYSYFSSFFNNIKSEFQNVMKQCHC